MAYVMAVAKQMYGIQLTSRPSNPPAVGSWVGVLRCIDECHMFPSVCELLGFKLFSCAFEITCSALQAVWSWLTRLT